MMRLRGAAPSSHSAGGLAVAIVLLLAGGCKDGRTITSGFTIAEAVFIPADISAATDHFVSLQVASTDVGTIFLDVVIHDVNDLVSGIALKLTYPAEFSRFIACTDGELFTSGTCFGTETSVGSGKVFIGRSVSASEATQVSGDFAVVRLEFLVFGVGEGSIVFEGQNLGGGDASAVLDEDGDPIFVEWFAGELTGIDSAGE